MRRATPVILCFFLAPALAHAREVAGVHFDDRITLEGTPLVLNGVGIRHVTIFGIEVYVAGLYVPSRTHDAADVLGPSHTRELVAMMKRDVGRNQIGPAFREAIERAAGTHVAELRPEISAFAAWLPAMREHERLTISYTPASRLLVTAGSGAAPFHGSAALADAVFGMWIGEHRVEDSLRDALLGR